MDDIEKIWNEGNAAEKNINSILSGEYIQTALKWRSQSIYSRFRQYSLASLVLSLISVLLVPINYFWYSSNLPVSIMILVFFLISIISFVFSLQSCRQLGHAMLYTSGLSEFLSGLLSFYTRRVTRLIPAMSLSIILLSVSFNLFLERADGYISFNEMLILSLFYILVFISEVFLFQRRIQIYVLQLTVSLKDLEENRLSSFENEMKQERRVRVFISMLLAVAAVSGLILLIW